MLTNELRLGNWIFSKIHKHPIQVQGIRRNGDIDITQPKDAVDTYSDSTNFEPLYLNSDRIKILEQKGILRKKPKTKNHYNFQGATTTYFLVNINNEEEENCFIAILNPNLPEGYSRVTRPFVSVHKLQNAFYTIYDKELQINF